MVKLINNTVASVNILYCMGFFLAANTTYFVLKKLGISKESSFVGAILYAFIPYHFYRGIFHFDYALYWPIPLLLYYCLAYMKEDNLIFKNGKKLLNKDTIFYVISLIIIGSRGVYFVYFSCFFLCAVILYKLLRKEKVFEVVLTLLIILSVFIINCIPMINSIMTYGYNNLPTNRPASDVESFGLKFVSLLIPVDMHIISLFAELKETYNTFTFAKENSLNVSTS